MDQATTQNGLRKKYNPFAVIVTVAILLLLVSSRAHWHGQQVSLPRYCENVAETTRHLGFLLEHGERIDSTQRRTCLIASRLLFLIPRSSGEPRQDYLRRLEPELGDRCR
ncbi:hypothetical protein ACFL17_02000 [Pseudomonadota bacterium]